MTSQRGRIRSAGKVIKPDAAVCDINMIRRRWTDPHVHMIECKQLIFGTVTDILIQ
ncbi:hypothetical protein AVEN_230500-1, partial [Araneus ventricosus]